MNPNTVQTEAQAKANSKWFADSTKKSQTKKERLLALAQKIAQQNAENVNQMFEIMKLED